jgi:hypothetical protein
MPELPLLIAEILVRLVREIDLIAFSYCNKNTLCAGHDRFKLLPPHRRGDLRHLYFRFLVPYYERYIELGYMHSAQKSIKYFNRHIKNSNFKNEELFKNTFKYNDVELSSWCIDALQINIDKFNPYHFDNLDDNNMLYYLQWLLKTMHQHKVHLIHKAINIHKFDILADKDIDLIYYVVTIFQLSIDAIDELCCVIGGERLASCISHEALCEVCEMDSEVCKFLIYIANANKSDVEFVIRTHGKQSIRDWYDSSDNLIFPKYKYVRDSEKKYPFYISIHRYST